MKLNDPEMEKMFISPLASLTSLSTEDVRMKQVACVTSLLQSSGDTIKQSWGVILGIIGAAAETPRFVM